MPPKMTKFLWRGVAFETTNIYLVDGRWMVIGISTAKDRYDNWALSRKLEVQIEEVEWVGDK